MTHPEEIIERIKEQSKTSQLSGSRILITAGPTREPIDPVRFMSNYSSGKMGYAIAMAAKAKGASVELISGPVMLNPITDIRTTYVETSSEMYEAVKEKVSDFDIFISTAAIADYKPANYSDIKYKKNKNNITIEFTRGIDILETISKKYKNLFTVGFAAETNSLKENSEQKLAKKNLDIIVGNIANHELKLGFESDYNEVIMLSNTHSQKISHDKKSNIANKILDCMAIEYSNKLQLVNKNVK